LYCWNKAKAAGCVSVELIDSSAWPTLKKDGLSYAIASAGTQGSFTREWNNSAYYSGLLG
jgi:hypothetical protein